MERLQGGELFEQIATGWGKQMCGYYSIDMYSWIIHIHG